MSTKTKRSYSILACAAAVAAVVLASASARADDDCYYGTRYARRVYVNAPPIYGPRSTTVVYDSSPYVTYTRTYAAPAVTYVEPLASATVVYNRPVRYRTVYRDVRPYRYGYRLGGVSYGHRGHQRGWSFGISRYGRHGYHGYGHYRHGYYGRHGRFGRHHR